MKPVNQCIKCGAATGTIAQVFMHGHQLASPFIATFREMLEMRYLWRTPVRMDNAKLTAVLGYEPHTPLEEAVEATLLGMGSLPDARLSPVSA